MTKAKKARASSKSEDLNHWLKTFEWNEETHWSVKQWVDKIISRRKFAPYRLRISLLHWLWKQKVSLHSRTILSLRYQHFFSLFPTLCYQIINIDLHSQALEHAEKKRNVHASQRKKYQNYKCTRFFFSQTVVGQKNEHNKHYDCLHTGVLLFESIRSVFSHAECFFRPQKKVRTKVAPLFKIYGVSFPRRRWKKTNN